MDILGYRGVPAILNPPHFAGHREVRVMIMVSSSLGFSDPRNPSIVRCCSPSFAALVRSYDGERSLLQWRTFAALVRHYFPHRSNSGCPLSHLCYYSLASPVAHLVPPLAIVSH